MGQAVIFCCTNAAGTCIILFKGGDIVKIMYISNGSLGMYDGSNARPVASQRVEQLARTLRQLEQQHAWKTEGEGAKFMHQHNPYANAAEQMRGKVTAVAPHHEGIIYAVDLGRTGGMYTKILAAGIATAAGITTAIIDGSTPENLYELLGGGDIGTVFPGEQRY